MVIFELLGFDVNISGDFPSYFIFYKFNNTNKENILEKIDEIFAEKKVSVNFSSSILESTNLVVVEAIEELDKEILSKFDKLEYINEIKFANRL